MSRRKKAAPKPESPDSIAARGYKAFAKEHDEKEGRSGYTDWMRRRYEEVVGERVTEITPAVKERLGYELLAKGYETSGVPMPAKVRERLAAVRRGEIGTEMTRAQMSVHNKRKEETMAARKKTPAKGKGSESTGRRGRARRWDDDATIEVNVDENPKREGSKAHRLFELYRKNKTVGKWFAAGGETQTLRWDFDHGFIAINGEANPVAKPKPRTTPPSSGGKKKVTRKKGAPAKKTAARKKTARKKTTRKKTPAKQAAAR